MKTRTLLAVAATLTLGAVTACGGGGGGTSGTSAATAHGPWLTSAGTGWSRYPSTTTSC